MPPTSYRDDPEWIRARDIYVSEDLPGTADERLATRSSAVLEMYRIEMDYARRK